MSAMRDDGGSRSSGVKSGTPKHARWDQGLGDGELALTVTRRSRVHGVAARQLAEAPALAGPTVDRMVAVLGHDGAHCIGG
jgi:hypothetical protein